MDGWDREIVETVQRVESHVNSRVELFLRAGEFVRNKEVFNIRLATDETPGVDLRTHNYPTYRVSQEECEILRESVPYVKLYRYNPKHLYPKLNGY